MRFPLLLALPLAVTLNAIPDAHARGGEGAPTPESDQANAAESVPVNSDSEVPPQPIRGKELAELLQALRETHPWAKWRPGAWRRVRVVTEAFDTDRKAIGRSVTERLERLLACDETTYEIQVEAVSQVSGRPTPAPVEQHKFWIANNRPLELGEPDLYAEPPSSISLAGMMTPCRVWRISQPNAVGRQSELLYLTASDEAKLVRRELSTTDESGGVHLVETVTAAGTPVLYGESLLNGWRRVTTVTRPDGSKSQSLSVHSSEVPGGLHRDSLAEYDESGRCFRWTVTELLAAGSSEDDQAVAEQEPDGQQPPALSIEIRPRRFLRLLRRQDEKTDEPEPLQ